MFTLPPLPYPEGALEPVISANTLRFHHGKHHKAYVDKLNELVKGTEYESAPLESIILASASNAGMADLYHNAAQAWNHAFYWNSLRAKGAGAPAGSLAQKIDADFGGYEAFKKEFAQTCVTQFGSGWGWLVVERNKLKIAKTGNADDPLSTGQIPLLTIDVWEHAYYLDYQNRRPDYVNAVLDKLLNWSFAEQNFVQNSSQGAKVETSRSSGMSRAAAYAK
jgi:superoxide dismutase, Fe-Mn family